MDELTRDLLNGVGGLQKIEDGLDGNLAGSLEGAAMQEVARSGGLYQAPPRAVYAGPTLSLKTRLILAGVAVLLLLIVLAVG